MEIHEKAQKSAKNLSDSLFSNLLGRFNATVRGTSRSGKFSPREAVWYCAELDSRLCYDPGVSFEPFTYRGQPVDRSLTGFVGEFLLESDGKFVFRAQVKSFHKENGVFVVIESDTGFEYTYVRVLDGNIPG